MAKANCISKRQRSPQLALIGVVMAIGQALGCVPSAFEDRESGYSTRLAGSAFPTQVPDPYRAFSDGDDSTAGDEQPDLISPISYEEPADVRDEGAPNEAELPELLPDATEEVPPPANAGVMLTLDDVVNSVQLTYPLLDVAARERIVAAGKQLAAWGEFDLGLEGHAIETPLGFYQTYRHGLALNQPLYKGGYVAGGYRIGDGNFEPWYGGRETNEGGEFAAEFGVPLLQNRTIDKRRTTLQKATLERQAVEPRIRAQLLDFVRLGTQHYWMWVAAGRIRVAQAELLELAQVRVQQIRARIQAGDMPQNTDIDNQRLIASREAKLIEAERKLQAAAIKLSLFLRTPDGTPVLAGDESLPEDFPQPLKINVDAINVDIERAVAARPELAELDLLARQVRVEIEQADNLLLPKLDLKVKASKDVGGEASTKGDKTPFKMEAGLFGDVPLQRRYAQGELRAAQGKLAQLRAKRQFTTDKIVTEVQDAVSAMQLAAERIERTAVTVKLAHQSLDLARQSFDAGDIDVIMLNIYEQAVTDAEILHVAAQADFFIAEADYRAALGIVPELPNVAVAHTSP